MTTIQQAPRRGRGLIIAGSVMLVLSVVGGIVGSVLVGRGLDWRDLEREISVRGPNERLVPGEISFRVPLSDGSDPDAEISVGVATDRAEADPECRIEDDAGEAVETVRPRVEDELLVDRPDFELALVARLAPGEYVAVCEAPGSELEGGSTGFDVNFTVGRVIGFDDVQGFIGPFFGVLAVIGVASVVFLVGLVLLIVGLVQSSRSKRPPVVPYGGYPGPQGYGQPPYGQPPYGQPPTPQAYGPQGYGPPSHGPMNAPPWPGPHPPGPPEAQTPVHPPHAPQAPAHPAPPDEWSAPHVPGTPPAPPTPPPGSEPDDHGGWTIPPSKR